VFVGFCGVLWVAGGYWRAGWIVVGIVLLCCTQSRGQSANQAGIRTEEELSLFLSLEHPQQRFITPYLFLRPSLPSASPLTLHSILLPTTRTQLPANTSKHTTPHPSSLSSQPLTRTLMATHHLRVSPSRCAWPAPQSLNLQPRPPGFA
jgi:hypothetical protein